MNERRKEDNGRESAKIFGGLDAKTLLILFVLGGGSGVGAKFGLDQFIGGGGNSEIMQKLDAIQHQYEKHMLMESQQQASIDRLEKKIETHEQDDGVHEPPDKKEERIRKILDREIKPFLSNIQADIREIKQDVKK